MGNLRFCEAKWSRKTKSNLLGAPLRCYITTKLYARRICAKFGRVCSSSTATQEKPLRFFGVWGGFSKKPHNFNKLSTR